VAEVANKHEIADDSPRGTGRQAFLVESAGLRRNSQLNPQRLRHLNSAESPAGSSVRDLPLWTLAKPLIGGVLAAAAVLGVGGYFAILVGLGLAGTVFAVGLSLLVGGLHHRAQEFSLQGVSAARVALASITVMTLVFPNFTATVPGPFYSPSQLALVALVSAAIYAAFIVTQTIAIVPYSWRRSRRPITQYPGHPT
jgi:hypothetical protein